MELLKFFYTFYCRTVKMNVLPLKLFCGSDASRTARLRPIPEEQPVISTTFLSMMTSVTDVVSV